jgi:hypothetical protein
MARYAVVFILLLLCQTALSGSGRVVNILLKSDTSFVAELLAVRDTALIVSTAPSASEEDLWHNLASIRLISRRSIRSVYAEGASHTWMGVGIGVLGGGVAGALIGSATSPTDESTIAGAIVQPIAKTYNMGMGSVIGGLAGGLAGLIIGSASSTPEISVVPEQPPYLQSLSKYARYQDGEPGFLKTLK